MTPQEYSQQNLERKGLYRDKSFTLAVSNRNIVQAVCHYKVSSDQILRSKKK